MKVSYNWLKDFVDIKDSAEQLAAKLTMAGLEVADSKRINDDWVFEIEITSNRPDCLSHIGIAREVAAIAGKKMSQVTSHKSQVKKMKHGACDLGQVSIKLEDKTGCPLYTARIISNIAVSAPEDFVANRLNILGLRGVNNIVDITNYILLETGQPVHAFDLDKILRRSKMLDTRCETPLEIIIRRAISGEKIITIDGIERSLSDDNLIIADTKGAIAIAGVMGSKDTEVDISTKTVLLESAYFDPLIIRRSRQRLGINTESSYRFERGVHILSVYSAQGSIEKLISKICPKANFSKIFETRTRAKIKPSKKNLVVDTEALNKLLGLIIPKERIKNILISLGFKVKSAPGSKLKLEVPDFRQDINIGEDVVEEVARIYGYDNISSSIPPINIRQLAKIASSERCERTVKTILCSSGFFEVIPYSLTSQERALNSSQSKEEIIEIENPLSKEQQVLAPSLLSGLLDVAAHNFDHSEDEVKIFHIGSVFMSAVGGVQERLGLGILACGRKTEDWYRGACLKEKNQFNFFDLKGILEEVLEQLGINMASSAFRRMDSPVYVPGNCAQIWIDNKSIGTLGRVSPSVLKKWDIRKQDIFASLIDLGQLEALVDLSKHFKMFSLFPSSKRDISFIVKEDISVKDIKDAIVEKRIPILEAVSIFDEYRDSKLPPACRSLSFSLQFNTPERTLKEDEINEAMKEIKQLLTQRFSVTFR